LYPFYPGDKDADGTDRIMVGTSFNINVSQNRDGYASQSKRPDNLPRPIVLNFSLGKVVVKAANLQVFMDDFQPTKFGSRYSVKLNGVRLDNFEKAVNTFNQHGPIGKLVTISILPEYLPLLKTGKLELLFDDPFTGNGDGFAIDFVRLVINPKNSSSAGSINGIVIDEKGNAIDAVVVNANQQVSMNTGTDGKFILNKVAAGLVSINAAKAGYQETTQSFDLYEDQVKSCTLKLTKLIESASLIEKQLKQSGKVALYGLYFDVNKSELKPESEIVLNDLYAALKKLNYKKILISGHTDNDGDDAYNLNLSERRAEEVLRWLIKQGIETSSLSKVGLGELRPVASNLSSEGKALNRRVEVEVVE
jgi:outer membrane protein OmpA-like peptidoglycan-associated protein